MFNRRLTQRVDEIARKLDELSTAFRQVEAAVERTTNSKLAADVDALAAAFDTSRRSLRSELSKLWGRLGAEAAQAAADSPPTRDALRSAFLGKRNG